MPNARPRNGETAEAARLRYNADQREYRALRKAQGRPLAERERTEDVYKAERRLYIKRTYGVTYEFVEAMLTKQGNVCAICKTPVSLLRCANRGAIDHDHETGRVRGILCMQCNQGLGKFKDSPSLLTSAIAYLTP